MGGLGGLVEIPVGLVGGHGASHSKSLQSTGLDMTWENFDVIEPLLQAKFLFLEVGFLFLAGRSVEQVSQLNILLCLCVYLKW